MDYSQFQESPGYQFAQDEAQRAIERSAAARGDIVSGRTLKELDERSQQIANQQYGSYLNRLGGLFGTSFGAGQASAQVPFNVAAQTVPLDIYGQQVMAQGNIARTAGIGSGVGALVQTAADIATGGATSGLGGMGGATGATAGGAGLFQGGAGGFGGVPFGGFGQYTGVPFAGGY